MQILAVDLEEDKACVFRLMTFNNDYFSDTLYLYFPENKSSGNSFENQNEVALKNETRIYPNPSGGKLTIETGGESRKNITVTDFNGKRVLEDEFYAQQTKLDLSGQAAGVYFIQIKDGDQITIEKIVLRDSE